MTPMSYIVKAGACTLAELSSLARTDKGSVDTLKKWAADEMNVLGVPIDAPPTLMK